MLLRGVRTMFILAAQFVNGGLWVDLKLDCGKHFEARVLSNVEMLGGSARLKAHIHPWAVFAQERTEVFLSPNDAAREFVQVIERACLAAPRRPNLSSATR